MKLLTHLAIYLIAFRKKSITRRPAEIDSFSIITPDPSVTFYEFGAMRQWILYIICRWVGKGLGYQSLS
ncbi:hypothetical protein EYC80_009723 [Monilinia laxa]|uniref:Uncharacterized protein n=1 Tax=Monilinia laxa TaxID=61186 RepID=A0A5N6JYR6_MONLA|nr:hypothetical protein EYC80_009723 [Monilinia laxa]